MYKHIPNIITVCRLILALPLTVLAFWTMASPPLHLFVVLSAITLSLSDMFDGRLARRWHCTSKFGEKWDPIADKLTVLLYLPLVYLEMIHLIPVLLIFLRDLLSLGLRLAINQAVPARISGKIKTVANLIFMCLLFAAVPVQGNFVPLLATIQAPLYWISSLVISAICLWSGWDYIHALWLKTRE